MGAEPGTGRVQSGNTLNFGNVRVEGMTIDELQKAFEIRIDPATKIVYTLPQDIIDNTIKAFSTSATASGYGALGPPTGRYLAPANGPDCIQAGARRLRAARRLRRRADLHAVRSQRASASRSRQGQLRSGGGHHERVQRDQLQCRGEAGSGATINQVTQSYQDPNVTFDPGGRLMQLVFRINF